MKKETSSRSPAGDDVASLIRLAGHRLTVPEERAERVKQAARDHWREELRRRSRRRRLWAGAAAAAAALLVTGIGMEMRRRTPPPAQVSSAMRVESIVHPVRARSAGGDSGPPGSSLSLGDVVPAGAEIATKGGGSVAILMPSGHSVRLDVETRVRMVSESLLYLERGALYVDSGERSDAEGATLAVRTRLGVVRDVGTQYQVRVLDDSIQIRVREGTVILDGRRGSHRATVGTELAMDAAGIPILSAAPVHGADWEWVERIAPVLDLKGRSLREFLDWISRERGWKLSFAEDATARSASGISLSGSIRGLTLDEALDAVLPTCGMTYQIDDGVLTIAPLQDIPEAG